MEVSPSLQIQARKYLEYVNKEGNIYSNQHQSLNMLSKYLREGIFTEVYVKSLMSISFLKQYFSLPFIQKLALSMKEMNFGPDELIMKRGILEEEFIFVVASGEVEVFMDVTTDINKLTYNGIKPFKKLKKGEHFGAYEFFTNQKNIQYNIRSLGVSRIQCLALADFKSTIEEFPSDREVYSFLKDNLIYNSNYYMLNQQCLSCGSSAHLIQNCQLLFYTPHQIRVIRIYNKQNDQIRLDFKRSMIRKKYKTLLHLNDNLEIIEKFICENINQFDQSTFFDSDISQEEEYDTLQDYTLEDEIEGQVESQEIITNNNINNNTNINSNLKQNLMIRQQQQKRQSIFSGRAQMVDKQLGNISENLNEDEQNDSFRSQISSHDIQRNDQHYKLSITSTITEQKKSLNQDLDQSNQIGSEDTKSKQRNVSFAQDQILSINRNNRNSSSSSANVISKLESDADFNKDLEDNVKKTVSSIRNISINNMTIHKHNGHFCEEDNFDTIPSQLQVNTNLNSTPAADHRFEQSSLYDFETLKKNFVETTNTSDIAASSYNQARLSAQGNSKNNTQSSIPISQKLSQQFQTTSLNALTSPTRQNASSNVFKFPENSTSINIGEKNSQQTIANTELNAITRMQKKLLLRKNKTDQQRSKDERLRKQGKTVDSAKDKANSIQNFVVSLMQRQHQREQHANKNATDQMAGEIIKNAILQNHPDSSKKSNIQILNQYMRRASKTLNSKSISQSLGQIETPSQSVSNIKMNSMSNLKNISDEQDFINLKRLLKMIGIQNLNAETVKYTSNDDYLDTTSYFDKHPFDIMKAYKVYFPMYNFRNIISLANRTYKYQDQRLKKKRTMAERKKTMTEKKKTMILKKKKTLVIQKKPQSDTSTSEQF